MRYLLIILAFVSFSLESYACLSGRGISTNRIEINFEMPAEADSYAIYRNGNEIVKFESLGDDSISSNYVDAQNLLEGETYLYSCSARINGSWVEDGRSLQLSTLAINGPNFKGIDSIEIKADGSFLLNWELVALDNPVPVSHYKIEVYESLDSTDPIISHAIFDAKEGVFKFGKRFDTGPLYFRVNACSRGGICETNRVFIKL
jgi:hypothetical protein